MEGAVEQFKQRARATWAAGKFDEVAALIRSVGPRLVERAQVARGMTVLDVACGTGNSSIPAALAGGKVTGLDLTPELFDDARRHATEAGVAVDWVEGDAEALPFPDASFDRVLSSFGVMFAPRHAVAASELARVLRPSGVMVLSTWPPEGVNGEMFKLMSSKMPPPPPFAEPPLLWGSQDHVRELLEPNGLDVEFEHDQVLLRDPSIEASLRRMEDCFGPWQMAKAALGDDWPVLRQQLADTYERWNQSTDGSVAIPADYLVTIAHRPG